MKDKSPPVTASLGFGISPKPKNPVQRKDSPPAQRKARIMLVDNDPEARRLMSARLGAAGYEVESVNDAQAALDGCVRLRPNLVVTDLRLQGMDGLALLKELKSRWPSLTVIIVTAHGTIPDAVQATQYGAFSFLIKPVEKGELLGQVERAIANSTFTLVEGDWRSKIVSRSQLMEERLELANRAAGTNAPVLLTGENGTGKELLARAIHAASTQRDKPFVTVACAERIEDELGAELFGHAEDAAWLTQTGVFQIKPSAGDSPARADVIDTDDSAARTGAFHAARDGTLLLDEIGDLPLALQALLVAALRRAPGAAPRLICTTSRDLKKLMDTGSFRQDLYYQINVLPIEIPPLGRRREDIPLLVSHFLEQATEPGGAKKIYTPQAIELLATTDWPGNVRQLFDLVKRNVALAYGKVMTKEFVQESLGRDAKQVPTYDEARDEFARDYLKENLQATSGNVSRSARLAKRNRTDFYKLLARYRLQPDDFKNPERGPRKKRPDEE